MRVNYSLPPRSVMGKGCLREEKVPPTPPPHTHTHQCYLTASGASVLNSSLPEHTQEEGIPGTCPQVGGSSGRCRFWVQQTIPRQGARHAFWKVEPCILREGTFSYLCYPPPQTFVLSGPLCPILDPTLWLSTHPKHYRSSPNLGQNLWRAKI